MGRNVRPRLSDATNSNRSGDNYLPTIASTGRRTTLANVTVFVPTSVGADRVLWLFDSATATTTAPKHVLTCTYGLTSKLAFEAGSLFANGLYVVVGTNEPADATTAVTAASNNQAIVAIDYTTD